MKFSNAFLKPNYLKTTTMIKEILGTDTGQAFLILLFFSAIGVTLSLLLHASNRDQQAPSTPVKFSFWFLIKDNWKRILTSFLLIYIAIRFTPELFGVQITSFWALAIGLCLDKLAQWIKEKTNILDVKR